MRYRYTIKELNEWSDYDLLRRLVYERQTDCTNIYAPLYKRLINLKNKLEKKGELSK